MTIEIVITDKGGDAQVEINLINQNQTIKPQKPGITTCKNCKMTYMPEVRPEKSLVTFGR